jgi:hypothetical protein
VTAFPIDGRLVVLPPDQITHADVFHRLKPGIQATSLTRVLGRRSPADDDGHGSTTRRILLATPDAEIPSGVRMALRIRSISASCMRTSMPHPCYERMTDIRCVAQKCISSMISIRGVGTCQAGLWAPLQSVLFHLKVRPNVHRQQCLPN